MVFKPDAALDHDPMQIAARDAILAFMVGIAEAEETAKRESRMAGIAHARAAADAATLYRGKKPSYTRAVLESVQDALSGPVANVSAIAAANGVSRQTVLRIKGDPAGASAALIRWGL